MAFRPGAYQALGGFQPVPCGEDAALLDDAGRAEIDRLWSELEFVSEQPLATPAAYAGLVQY